MAGTMSFRSGARKPGLRDKFVRRVEPKEAGHQCRNLLEGENPLKYLRRAGKDRSWLIMSPDQKLHPPLVKSIRDVRLTGRAIRSWRER